MKFKILGAVVLGGMLKDKGMVGFYDRLSTEEAGAIHAYIIKRAHDVIEGKE